jgi:sulfite reductase (ferredoxin)
MTNATTPTSTLPRFSDPRDIDQFVEKLEAFERGELGPEQFRAFRLTRGVYGQRQDGAQMLRIKIPFGLLGPEQINAIAEVADTYSRGFGHVTTRQNIQLHFVQMENAETAMRRLDEVGLTTRDACGNTVRTVTACEVAEVCSTAPFDVSPYAEALTRYFLRHPLSGTLPRKFKPAFSGCASDCAKAAIHDLGFVAKVENGERGFKVLAAGGLSTSPQNALVLHEFVHAGEILRVGEAILRIFDRMGNRDNKARARLKYVLKKLGEEKFRATYAEVKAEVDAEAIAELKIPPPRVREASPVVIDENATERAPGFLAWKMASTFEQKDGAHVAVYVRLKLGDITATEMRAIAAIIAKYGDGTLRLTIDQNLVMPWIDRKTLPALYAALDAAGLARLDLHTARDVTSCPGADTCNLAVTTSRQVATAITARLEKENASDLSAMKSTVIKVSGCPNSCGQHHVADIGFHGGAKTVAGVTYPVYQLHLGGGVDANGARFGRQVVKLVASRVPDAVVKMLALYETDHAENETPATYFHRVDPKKVNEALAALLTPPEKGDEVDLGEKTGFQVHTGDGECAA